MDNLTFLVIAIFVFIVIVFFLWLFVGGESKEFEGLDFLKPPVRDPDSSEDRQDSNPSENPDFCNIVEIDTPNENNVESSTIIEEEIVEVDDICPEESKGGESTLFIPAVKVNLPSLSLDYYANYSLTIKNNTKMERKTAAESRGEKHCRAILEKFFEKPFPTVRPDFLKNPETQANLELDCYNADLRLALEYNGAQHYVYPNKFHKTEEAFKDQVRRDQYKKQVCDSAGVYLIQVPYTVPYSQLPKYIEYYLPENVDYRAKHGIEELAEDQLWESDNNRFPKNGFV